MNKRAKKKLGKRFSDIKDLVMICNPETFYRLMKYKKFRLVNEIDAEEANREANSHTLIKICVYRRYYYNIETFAITSPSLSKAAIYYDYIDNMRENLNVSDTLGMGFGISAMRKELIEQALSGTSIHDRIFPNTNKKE